jgi:hypothetical protein
VGSPKRTLSFEKEARDHLASWLYVKLPFDIPRRISAEGHPRFVRGDKKRFGVTIKKGSVRPSYPVLSSDSETSLTSFGTASFLTSFGTASTHHLVFSSVARKLLPGVGKRLKGRPLTSLGVTRKWGALGGQ